MENYIYDTIKTGNLNVTILKTGDIERITLDDTAINQYKGNIFDGSLYRIYLQTENENYILTGTNSNSEFCVKENKIYYKGRAGSIDYTIVFCFFENKWFVDIKLKSDKKQNVSLYYAFDVGLCSFTVNELYNSQYIDHKVDFENNICTIMSKQNQGRPLMLESSCLNKIESYSTDGFQFYGMEYKDNNFPRALRKRKLDSKSYQYEFGYPAFKSESITVDGEEKTYTFYHILKDNYNIFPPIATDRNTIQEFYKNIDFSLPENKNFTNFKHQFNTINTLSSDSITDDEILKRFTDIHSIEYDNDKNLLSFFADNHSHIVLRQKEIFQERPSAMVFSQSAMNVFESSPLAYSCYMYGVFMSHIVMGNTDINYYNYESKTPLNIMKHNGLRVWIKHNNKYKLLTLPAYYIINLNGCEWVYRIDDDEIVIKTYISFEKSKIQFELISKNAKQYDFIITDTIFMSDGNPLITYSGDTLTYSFNPNSFVYKYYPNLKYSIKLKDAEFDFVDEKLNPATAERNNESLILRFNSKDKINLMISASESNEKFEFENIVDIKNEYYKKFTKNLYNYKLSGNDFCTKINDLTAWYTENALIHYGSPHGIEQCFGGAWGTRDVLQGPVELFLTLKKFDIAKNILLKVYSRQQISDFGFPQWFMFDNYKFIHADSSHGDIIVWPLKAISEYIKQSGDLNILDCEVPYFDNITGNFTDKKDSIFNHILNELNVIKNSFINGTHLSCYGGGDWDDTLQPKDKSLSKNMVSGWTILLTLDAISSFIKLTKNTKYDITEFEKIYNDMHKDYFDIVVKDNIPAGFVYFSDKTEYMLHPLDKKSGIKYRLLPLTRGMLGEIFDSTKVEDYLKIIDEYLMYPDGVRLMSDPIKYNYGKNSMFMRAETASNFGREIGMQYVHAHIRYCESMSVIGKNDRLYNALNQIIPINIKDSVKNANLRQANVYFSSSDANFLNRFEAYENFDKIKKGTVNVKSGWRLYSSGCGIFLKQIYQSLFGIKFFKNNLLLDPVMPKCLDNSKIELDYNGKKITFNYHINGDNSVIYKAVINGKELTDCLKNKYRNAGIIVDKTFIKNNTVIDIYTK